jgi:hypothetical protein
LFSITEIPPRVQAWQIFKPDAHFFNPVWDGSWHVRSTDPPRVVGEPKLRQKRLRFVKQGFEFNKVVGGVGYGLKIAQHPLRMGFVARRTFRPRVARVAASRHDFVCRRVGVVVGDGGNRKSLHHRVLIRRRHRFIRRLVAAVHRLAVSDNGMLGAIDGGHKIELALENGAEHSGFVASEPLDSVSRHNARHDDKAMFGKQWRKTVIDVVDAAKLIALLFVKAVFLDAGFRKRPRYFGNRFINSGHLNSPFDTGFPIACAVSLSF